MIFVLRGKDAFVLCRIFQKSALGPPNGDRYAPFVEEEWDDGMALVVPGGVAEDDVANGDDARVDGNDLDQVCYFHVVESVVCQRNKVVAAICIHIAFKYKQSLQNHRQQKVNIHF